MQPLLFAGLVAACLISVPTAAADGADGSCNSSDLAILNFALSLEYLEAEFYRQGVANYTEENYTAAGWQPSVATEIRSIASHEATHVATLIEVITKDFGAACYVRPCTYRYPVTTAKGFLALARDLEVTGVSAYLGKLSSFKSKDYLTSSASILAIESSQSSYLNALNGYASTPNPFAPPLDSSSVLTLASPLFVTCDIKHNTYLSVQSQTTTSITLSYSGSWGSYCAFVRNLGVTYTPLYMSTSGSSTGTCALPNVTGTAFVYVTINNASSTLFSSSVVAGPVYVDINDRLSPTGTGYLRK